MSVPKIFELSCQTQNYNWGRKGSSSLVAQLLKGQSIDENLPYAELWMGIHPNAPSHVQFGNGEELAGILQREPKLLGNYVLNRWGTLPFLFKILSIAQPLSIQMHPDKVWAKQLHLRDPRNYPDDNHKPEIALCLSDLEALYEFEKKAYLTVFLKRYPFFYHFFLEKYQGSQTKSNQEVLFQDIIPLLMRGSVEESKILLQQLHMSVKQAALPSEKEKLFLSLYPKFSEDIGLLFVFFMQKIEIEPNQALFLRANQLHAYLTGNLAECMANSDNVIRAGITERYKDIQAMLHKITYHDDTPQLISGVLSSEWITDYSSESEEFELQIIRVPQNTAAAIQPIIGPSISLVLSGKGKLIFSDAGTIVEKTLEKGTVLFISADQTFKIETSEKMEIVRALVPNPN